MFGVTMNVQLMILVPLAVSIGACAAPRKPPAQIARENIQRELDKSPSTGLTPQGTPLTWRSALSTTEPLPRVTPGPRPPADEFEQQLDDFASNPPTAVAEPAAMERQPAPAAIDSVGVTIRQHCDDRYPVDFAMQRFCIDRQYEGLASVVEFYQKYAISTELGNYHLSEPAETIALHCHGRYPDDYQMRAFCIERQVEAARSLGRMR